MEEAVYGNDILLPFRFRSDSLNAGRTRHLLVKRQMTKRYCVYIMMNHSKTLYIGMTNDLRRRVAEHKEMLKDGFTKRYRITMLVYYEEYDDIRYAIERETRLKTWNRQKKLDLIRTMNPEFKEIEL